MTEKDGRRVRKIEDAALAMEITRETVVTGCGVIAISAEASVTTSAGWMKVIVV